MFTPQMIQLINMGLVNLIGFVKSLREKFPNEGFMTDAEMSSLATQQWSENEAFADAWLAAHPPQD